MLSREDILKAAAVPTDEVEIKSLGGSVRVRGLTTGEQGAIFDGRPLRQLFAPVCAAGIIDADGKPMFKEAELREMSPKVLKKPFARIVELSGLGEDEDDEIEKN